MNQHTRLRNSLNDRLIEGRIVQEFIQFLEPALDRVYHYRKGVDVHPDLKASLCTSEIRPDAVSWLVAFDSLAESFAEPTWMSGGECRLPAIKIEHGIATALTDGETRCLGTAIQWIREANLTVILELVVGAVALMEASTIVQTHTG